MPAVMVAGAMAGGLVFGWFRIAWIVVAAVFVYDVSRACCSARFSSTA